MHLGNRCLMKREEEEQKALQTDKINEMKVKKILSCNAENQHRSDTTAYLKKKNPS